MTVLNPIINFLIQSQPLNAAPILPVGLSNLYEELIEQTGASAFEHFQTPLWGATGQDAEGQPIELGMIAGALVNQRDIHKGVSTNRPGVAIIKVSSIRKKFEGLQCA